MAFASGVRFGTYEILTALGAGGMGEVYRARDTKLGREVALKILPDTFTHDPERLARFRREAQVLAALNHPHIAQIYGVDEANGTQFLVLELVDGESLDTRIARGPIPIDEALDVARQIADALEAAHEKGIIHRDLKPANIALTKDGQVKVLDFGLAKATEAASGTSFDVTNSPTITSPAMMTGVGVILGTAAYMSPEQAKGRAADKRSDIWAFGCVLYEMLTGKRAFEGQDVSDTLANVLKIEPEWHALPGSVPEHIRLLTSRCLEKDRNKRVSDASIARFLLAEPALTSSAAVTPGATLAATRKPLWRRGVPMAVLAIVVAAVTAIVSWRVFRLSAPPVTRFAIVLPEGRRFAARSQVLTISPDGSRVVYADASGQLVLRSMADMEVHPIPGTSLDAMSPFFSPDGQWIGFYSFQEGMLKKIAVSGGASVPICKILPPHGVSWDGDWIVFADEGAQGILRVSPNGGEPEVLAAVKPGEVFGAPQLLNDGKVVLFTVAAVQGNNRWDRAQIVVQSVGSTERKVILRGGSEGHYVPTGHLVYMLGGTLLAAPFDRRTLQVQGGPIPIIEDVRRFGVGSIVRPDASFAFSRGGSLVYLTGSPMAIGAVPQTIALATRDGKQQPLNLPARAYLFPRVSPDGSQLAIQTDDGTDAIIWIYDLKGGGPPRRLTFGGQNTHPVWAPDGRHVTFQSDRDGERGVFWQLADGTEPAERLSKPDPLVEHRPEAWTPSGKMLVFSGTLSGSLFTLSVDASGVAKAFAADFQGRSPAFSPDGKWLAYTSRESGNQLEVFVQPFPRMNAKYQVSTEGGRLPLWSPDGTHLYYCAGRTDTLVAVDVRTQPTFSFEKAVPLPIEATLGDVARNYDVTPDGKFVVIRPVSTTTAPNQSSTQQINVVLNWFEELKARVPAK